MIMQGDKLRWHMTPSHGYAIENLPGEVVAAGALATACCSFSILAPARRWQSDSSDLFLHESKN